MSDYNCTDHGHVWLETDGTPYTRHRGRSQADLTVTVAVSCAHCPLTADLPRYSQFSGKRMPGQPIDRTIPPQFKEVLARALTEQSTHGPVPKQP